MSKLLLHRDFTRFLEDDNFPHRVEVYVGEKKFVCSGMVLAQQSSVLEEKIRSDHGILMLEEMLDIGTEDQKIDCIKFMYGATLQFDIKSIETVLKFSSIYNVGDLFSKALKWIKQTMNSRNLVMYHKIAKSLEPTHCVQIQKVFDDFINKNADKCGAELAELLVHGEDIDPDLFINVLKNTPSNGNKLLKDWAGKSSGNILHILQNTSQLDFVKLFPLQEDFLSFIASLTQSPESVEIMKLAMTLQQEYFIKSVVATVPGPSNKVDEDKGNLSDASTTASASTNKSAKRKPRKKANSQKQGDKKTKEQPGDKVSTGPQKQGDKKTKEQPGDKVSTGPQKQGGSQNQGTDCPVNAGQLELERKIFVGNIPENATKELFTTAFASFGPITDVVIVSHKKCAFVSFRSVKASRKVLQNAESGENIMVGDTLVYVKPFTLQSNDQFSKDNNINQEKKVFVGNLPEGAQNQDIEAPFTSYGQIINIDIISHRKCAFVEFGSVKAVRKVLNTFANGGTFMVLGSQVYVKPFESKS